MSHQRRKMTLADLEPHAARSNDEFCRATRLEINRARAEIARPDKQNDRKEKACQTGSKLT